MSSSIRERMNEEAALEEELGYCGRDSEEEVRNTPAIKKNICIDDFSDYSFSFEHRARRSCVSIPKMICLR